MSRVEEGILRAAQMRATLSKEEVAKADALIASVPDLLRRAFCSPPNDHGRQWMHIATEEEYQIWLESHSDHNQKENHENSCL